LQSSRTRRCQLIDAIGEVWTAKRSDGGNTLFDGCGSV
jgi:hypothetical protein